MLNLNCFDKVHVDFQITGDILLNSNLLIIEFQINDPNHLIDFTSQGVLSDSKNNRYNELWKFTCFEAFWAEPQDQHYWELNLNTLGHWNLYRFNSYRQPSPPLENFDFELLDFNFSRSKLNVHLKPPIRFTQLEASLTSVIKTKSQETLYFSTMHARVKPDFHLREVFQIKRSRNL